MEHERIRQQEKVVNRAIAFYQKVLNDQLEQRAEAEFENDDLEMADDCTCRKNIEKYETIITDLAIIKRAIQNNKTWFKIHATAGGGCDLIYYETYEVLLDMGFQIVFGQKDMFADVMYSLRSIGECAEETTEWSTCDLGDVVSIQEVI